MSRLFLVFVAAVVAAVVASGARAAFGDRFLRVTYDHCIVTAGGRQEAPDFVCGYATEAAYGVSAFVQNLGLYSLLDAAVAQELNAHYGEFLQEAPGGSDAGNATTP